MWFLSARSDYPEAPRYRFPCKALLRRAGLDEPRHRPRFNVRCYRRRHGRDAGLPSRQDKLPAAAGVGDAPSSASAWCFRSDPLGSPVPLAND